MCESLAFVIIEARGLLDRIPRVGVTPKLVPLRVTLGDDHPSGHFSYINLRLVTSPIAMNAGCYLRVMTATALTRAEIQDQYESS